MLPVIALPLLLGPALVVPPLITTIHQNQMHNSMSRIDEFNGFSGNSLVIPSEHRPFAKIKAFFKKLKIKKRRKPTKAPRTTTTTVKTTTTRTTTTTPRTIPTTKPLLEKIKEKIEDDIKDKIEDEFKEKVKKLLEDYFNDQTEKRHVSENISGNIVEEYCTVDTRMLSEKQALILNPFHNELFEPDYDGIIQIKKGESYIAVCESPNVFKRITCQEKGVFVDDSKKPFNVYDIQCLKTYEVARYTGNKCMGKHKEISIGFNIPGGKFIPTLAICFDEETKEVLFSKHKISKSISSCMNTYDKPDRLNANLFGVDENLIHDLYTRTYQRTHVNALLGVAANSSEFINPTKDYVLGRGDFTGHCDFAYRTQQKQSFYYVNSAPQWMTTKSQNWRSLENSLKLFVSEQGKVSDSRYTIYTGTYGRSKLQNKDIYLKDFNKKKIVYVPEVFWKILYNDKTKEGQVFLVVNNPHLESYTPICKNTCPNNPSIPINWKKDDRNSGFAYCCEMKDFLSVVKVPVY